MKTKKNTFKRPDPKKVREHQLDLMDFLSEEAIDFPLQPIGFGTPADILGQDIIDSTKSDRIRKRLQEFTYPIYTLPGVPEKTFTRVLTFGFKLAHPGLISTDLSYWEYRDKEFHHVPLGQGQAYKNSNLDDNRHFNLLTNMGIVEFMHPVEVAIMSFFGFVPLLDLLLVEDSSEEEYKSLDNMNHLREMTEEVMDSGSIFVKEVNHEGHLPVFQVEPPELTDEQRDKMYADLIKNSVRVRTFLGWSDGIESNIDVEKEEFVYTQPAPSPESIPLNIYGVKEGYWFDLNRRTVTTKSELVIDTHKLKSRRLVGLELLEPGTLPGTNKVAFLNVDSIFNAMMNAVTLEGSGEIPRLVYDYHLYNQGYIAPYHLDNVPPLHLTEDMKQTIALLRGGNNREAAASVFGRNVTPSHTKLVKAYRAYLDKQKSKLDR